MGATSAARDVKKGSSRSAVIPLLANHGALTDGDSLWLSPAILPAGVRPASPDDPRLRVTLGLDGGRATLLYQPSRTSEELTPSKAWNRIRRELEPTHSGTRARAVNDAFTKEPGGKTLGELAEELQVWRPAGTRS